MTATLAASKRPKRTHVRLDKYAIFDIALAHRLSVHEVWLLESLCHLSDWETRSLEMPMHDLAKMTRIGRDTIPKALGTLEAKGLTKIIRPFGPGQKGEVIILAWDRLIVGTTARRVSGNSAKSGAGTGTDLSDTSPTLLRHFSDSSENYQGKEGSVRNKAARREGIEGVQTNDEADTVSNDDEKCATLGCTLPAGHPFTDACRSQSASIPPSDVDPTPAEESAMTPPPPLGETFRDRDGCPLPDDDSVNDDDDIDLSDDPGSGPPNDAPPPDDSLFQ